MSLIVQAPIFAIFCLFFTLQNGTATGPLVIESTQQLPTYTSAQRVLVILPGITQPASKLAERGQTAYSFGGFDQVVIMSYGEEHLQSTSMVPSVAPKLFERLDGAFPNARFVFDGYSKGGLIARWIAERVPEAEGRVEGLTQTDSPNQGSVVAKGLVENYKLSPGWAELMPNSETIRALNSKPVNDLSSVRIVQIWSDGDAVVSAESALGGVSDEYGNKKRIVVTGADLDSLGHSDMGNYFAKHASMYRRILEGDLPPEASKQIIQIGDLKLGPDARSLIPANWVQCQCTGDHQGIGIWVGPSYYHDPSFSCPE
jgi:hypothetical protein